MKITERKLRQLVREVMLGEGYYSRSRVKHNPWGPGPKPSHRAAGANLQLGEDGGVYYYSESERDGIYVGEVYEAGPAYELSDYQESMLKRGETIPLNNNWR